MTTNDVDAHQVRRLVSLTDSTALRSSWGSINWLSGQAFVPDSQITFGYVQIKPGMKNPRHIHPNSDEVLYLLEGELDHSLGDEMFRLTPGCALHIPAGVEHDARNTGSSVATMVVAYSTGDRQVIMLEEGEE